MNKRATMTSNTAVSKCDPQMVETEASHIFNRLSYQSSRINELSILLYERLEHFMTDPFPTAENGCEQESLSSGYFRSLSVCTQPVNEAIERLEEILRRLAV